MNDVFYKVDLHVHTPASNCYKGEKSEEGYWQILQSAIDNDVRVIAITDHNTIEGYEKLMQLKETCLQEYEFTKKYPVSEEVKETIQKKVELFNRVTIILGVEITLNPGVHIIVLCDDESKSELNSLLDDVGYTSDKRGCDAEFSIDTDVKVFLTNPILNGKIVLAPHVDSDNGIWNTLEGKYRSEIFKSSAISAITCNNPRQLDTIKHLTRNDPNYKRTTPFVCINASDAHRQSDIGSKHSYFKLSKFTFNGLTQAFNSPGDCISDTENQDFIDYAKKCAEYRPTIFLDEIDKLEEVLYAILNTMNGCILLGVNSNFERSGIALTCEDIEDSVKQTLIKIKASNNMNFAKYGCKTEPLGNGKSVGIVVIESECCKLWIDTNDVLYLYDEKSGYKIATVRDTEEIVKSRILSELQDFEDKTNNNIRDVIDEMKRLLNPVSKYALFDRIKTRCVPISYYFKIKAIAQTNDEIQGIFPEGQSTGNVYYTNPAPPRLDDAYLRYSCPVYQNNDEECLSKLYKLNTSSIVITRLGGCHIIDATENCFFECPSQSFLLEPKARFFEDNLSLYHIIAWLKTNIFIWTCLQKNSTANFSFPKVVFNSFIPYMKDYYSDTHIEDMVKDILQFERAFLENLPPLDPDNNLELYEHIKKIEKEHNDKINPKSYKIEKTIMQHFGIESDEEKMIFEDLEDEKIFVFKNEENEIVTECLQD